MTLRTNGNRGGLQSATDSGKMDAETREMLMDVRRKLRQLLPALFEVERLLELPPEKCLEHQMIKKQ